MAEALLDTESSSESNETAAGRFLMPEGDNTPISTDGTRTPDKVVGIQFFHNDGTPFSPSEARKSDSGIGYSFFHSDGTPLSPSEELNLLRPIHYGNSLKIYNDAMTALINDNETPEQRWLVQRVEALLDPMDK